MQMSIKKKNKKKKYIYIYPINREVVQVQKYYLHEISFTVSTCRKRCPIDFKYFHKHLQHCAYASANGIFTARYFPSYTITSHSFLFLARLSSSRNLRSLSTRLALSFHLLLHLSLTLISFIFSIYVNHFRMICSIFSNKFLLFPHYSLILLFQL